MTLIKTPTDRRPLCPNIAQPTHPAHAQATAILNQLYRDLPHDPDSQTVLAAPGDKICDELAYAVQSPAGSYMDLYHHTAGHVQTPDGDRRTWRTIETWWWRCATCGLVIPAQQTSPDPATTAIP